MFNPVGHPLQITEHPSADTVRSAVLAHDRIEPGFALPASGMDFGAKPTI